MARECASLAFSLLLLAGCQPAQPTEWQPSAQVLALGSEAEDDEERQLWRDLRKQIAAELRTRCGSPQRPRLLGDASVPLRHLQRGAAVYERRCLACHGANGGGNGPVSQYLVPRPRDYRRGIFKFTTTSIGSKPRRADLVRTLHRGVTGTSMPSFSHLPADDLQAVTDYVLVLTRRGELEIELARMADEDEEIDSEYVAEIVAGIVAQWTAAEEQRRLEFPPMPAMTAASVRAGHKLFLKYACNKCHGKDGRGGSFGNVDVGMDAWGNRAAAADLTSGMFRGGERPGDIYRRIAAGINGTPMPSFASTFADQPEAIWQLVHFVQDTGERRRRNLPPVDRQYIEELEREIAAEADATPAAAMFVPQQALIARRHRLSQEP